MLVCWPPVPQLWRDATSGSADNLVRREQMGMRPQPAAGQRAPQSYLDDPLAAFGDSDAELR